MSSCLQHWYGSLLLTTVACWLFGKTLLCRFAWRGSRKRLSRDNVWRVRSKPGCQIVGRVTTVWLITGAHDKSSLHCAVMLTADLSDNTGCRRASHARWLLKDISIHGPIWMSFWSILPVAASDHQISSTARTRRYNTRSVQWRHLIRLYLWHYHVVGQLSH